MVNRGHFKTIVISLAEIKASFTLNSREKKRQFFTVSFSD